MSEMGMVERVARALSADIDAGLPRFTAQPWEELSMPAKAALLHRAAVAIRTMRDPTPAMKAAGAKRIPEAGYDLAHDAWCTMIDAALTTSPST
jgi:hypothetical protein